MLFKNFIPVLPNRYNATKGVAAPKEKTSIFIKVAFPTKIAPSTGSPHGLKSTTNGTISPIRISDSALTKAPKFILFTILTTDTPIKKELSASLSPTPIGLFPIKESSHPRTRKETRKETAKDHTFKRPTVILSKITGIRKLVQGIRKSSRPAK